MGKKLKQERVRGKGQIVKDRGSPRVRFGCGRQSAAQERDSARGEVL